MTNYLLFFGESTPQNLRDRIPDFIKSGQATMSRGCHVADNLWAVQAQAGKQKELFDTLVAYLGDPSLRVVVATTEIDWAENNCTSAMKCFRSD
jgi:hypothetical protein